MIKALRGSRRDELIALTRRHLKRRRRLYQPMNDASAKPAERELFGAADQLDQRLLGFRQPSVGAR